jgi:hypothetical protein
MSSFTNVMKFYFDINVHVVHMWINVDTVHMWIAFLSYANLVFSMTDIIRHVNQFWC